MKKVGRIPPWWNGDGSRHLWTPQFAILSSVAVTSQKKELAALKFPREDYLAARLTGFLISLSIPITVLKHGAGPVSKETIFLALVTAPSMSWLWLEENLCYHFAHINSRSPSLPLSSKSHLCCGLKFMRLSCRSDGHMICFNMVWLAEIFILLSFCQNFYSFV